MSEIQKPEYEPTPEDYGKRFRAALLGLEGAREGFLKRSLEGKGVDPDDQNILNVAQLFESDRAERMIAEFGTESVPWTPIPEQDDDTGSYLEPQGMTFFNPDKLLVERIESTDGQANHGGHESFTTQQKIWLSYSLSNGVIEVTIETQAEDLGDPLSELRHPSSQPLHLPNGEAINTSHADRGWTTQPLEGQQLKKFVELIEHIVGKLVHLYGDELTRIRKTGDRWEIEHLR